MLFYRGMSCENVTVQGDRGTPITAYVAKPSGPGPFPGVVLVHHLPGWSEFYIGCYPQCLSKGHERVAPNRGPCVHAEIAVCQCVATVDPHQFIHGNRPLLYFWWWAKLTD
jgi:hypothetical protein